MASNLFVPYVDNSPFARGSALFDTLTAPLGSGLTPENVEREAIARRLQRVQNVKGAVGSKLFDALQNPTQLKKELWNTGNYTDLGEVNKVVEDLYASQNPRNTKLNPVQDSLAASSKTAEQTIAPPPEAVAKQKQQEALAKETAKKNQQTEIATARTPSGAAVQDIAALELPSMMTQAEPTASKTTSDEDLSKAMLRAGIAMMASKGDIWDALAAGFSGYQGSLDAEEEARLKKEKEDREYALDKYKTDLYGLQVQAQIANSRRGGGGGGEKPPNLSQQAAYGNYLLRLEEYVTERKDKLRETAFDPMKSEQERALALQELSKMEGQSAIPSFKK